MIDIDRLTELGMVRERQEEALRLKVYKDSRDILTIGYGRNLEDRGISKAEAEMMLANNVTAAISECLKSIPCFRDLSEPRQLVLIDMAHNMGIGRLMGFRNMLAALAAGDYARAAVEIRDSDYWRSETHNRAERNAQIMEA